MKAKSATYYLGNILIILSLIGIAYIFYPVISVYISPPPVTALDPYTRQFILSIPKIHATGEIIKNVDPSNKNEYMAALKKGIAHAKGTSLPGEKGTIYLFAHSSALPWELTRYNTIFLRLNELKKGDEITIFYEGQNYVYSVTGKKEVWPSDTKYLQNLKRNQLILQTCTPVGTDLKRLLVFAVPK